MATINDELRNFIGNDLLEGQDVGLSDTTPLLELGLINSMSLVTIQRFVQSQFGVDIPASEIMPTNFASITAIAELIERLRQTSVTEPKK